MQCVEPSIAIDVMIDMVRDFATQRAHYPPHMVPRVVQEDRLTDFAHQAIVLKVMAIFKK